MHATPITIVAEELNKICITRKGKEKKRTTPKGDKSMFPTIRGVSIYLYMYT